ncbi:tripartite tricarboxylate transporter TctB family protein [Thermodesulfobacteriota bacterium]
MRLGNSNSRPTSERAALLSVSVIGGIISVLYLVAVWQCPMGTPAKPGPGVYPVFVAVLSLLACLGIGLEALSLKDTSTQVDWPWGGAGWRVLQIMGACVAYVVMLSIAGHAIAAAVLSLIALQAIGGFRWYVKLGIAIALGIGSQLLFHSLLKVPLPKGIWLS